MPKKIAPEPCPGDGGATPAALAYLANFERLVIGLSGRLINLVPGELDREVTSALETIGRFAEVDRSYLFQFTPDGHYMNNTHEWCAPGIRPCIGELQGFPVEQFGYSVSRMQRGEVFYVPRVSELPPEAETERRELEREGRIAVSLKQPQADRYELEVADDASASGRASTGETAGPSGCSW